MSKKPFVDFRDIRSRITMEQVLVHYKLLDTFKRSAKSLSGPCPIHKGTNKTQFRVDTEKNIWNCFSECKHGGNTLDFICRARHQLKAFFGQPKRIAGHLQEADRNLTEKSALLDTHRREIGKVKDEMHQTHQLYLKQQISGDGFRNLYGPAEERLKQLNTELPKLEAEVDLLNVNKLSADEVLHEATTLYDRWPTLPSEDKRRVVEAIIEKLVIGNGEIDMTFSHVPSSEELCKSQSRLGHG